MAPNLYDGSDPDSFPFNVVARRCPEFRPIESLEIRNHRALSQRQMKILGRCKRSALWSSCFGLLPIQRGTQGLKVALEGRIDAEALAVLRVQACPGFIGK